MRRIINSFLYVALFLLALSCAKGTESIHVTGITLNSTSLDLIEGETANLVATISPKDADNQSIIWSSSNGSVASVNNGKVTALKAGTTTITAKSDDGGHTASCTVNVAPKAIEVTSIVISKTQLSLVEGDSETITATVKPDNATDKTVAWSSSDVTVATVDGGKVTAVKEGSAIITAKAGDKAATCAVKVEKKPVPVESVELNKTEIELDRGSSETLVATVRPNDATDKTVTWNSSNPAVASVDQNGNVSAIKEGTATITVTTNDGSKKATCKVTVRVPVESISLNKNELTLYLGSSETLSATVRPDNATDKTVIWSSSDVTVATVDGGKVTAVKEGSAIITAKAGDKAATCAVKVEKKPVPVESVELNKTEIELDRGSSETLVATVRPNDATDKTVTWNSSNPAVASVDQNGNVSAIKEGTATITVTTNNGSKKATCKVTVRVPVESISLNKNELTLYLGSSETLSATVKPDDATDKTITWVSMNPSVATVDASGKVTASQIGETKIIAKSGKETAECHVIVIPVPVSSITLSDTTLKMKIGGTKKLIATINPDNATDKTVTWESSDVSIVTVSNNGLVTAIKKGNATIVARSSREGVYASCEVQVLDDDSNVGGNDMNYDNGDF